ncbi:MAG: arginyltransferase [Polyangiaceae bacterium]|nr:arginyltransferase [Polyangiaceae bacterium]
MARPQGPLPQLIAGSPPELLVYDEPQRCPYLPDRIARMPLRLPARQLRAHELDQRLSVGDRRQGFVLYRTSCATCRACEPVRIPVETFERNRSHRRIFRRGERELSVDIGFPVADQVRVDLYNKHKRGRGLGDGQPDIDVAGYQDFLVNSCCESLEIRFRLGQELVGVAVADRGKSSLSAVYCFYNPDHQHLSLGTYAILKQLELCRDWGLSYLYLGLYIADSSVMRYKARFLPHERLIAGAWRRF